MKLSGNHRFKAKPELIWSLLMDPHTLTAITPGVDKLEPTGPDQYTAISEVKIGPVKGSFKGDMEVAEKNEPNRFLLKVKQNSKIGNVNAEVAIELQPEDEQHTTLSFDGVAKLSGLLARTGQRVLSGVSSSLTKQFFQAMEDELDKKRQEG